jgi:hypothetical protein
MQSLAAAFYSTCCNDSSTGERECESDLARPPNPETSCDAQHTRLGKAELVPRREWTDGQNSSMKSAKE